MTVELVLVLLLPALGGLAFLGLLVAALVQLARRGVRAVHPRRDRL